MSRKIVMTLVCILVLGLSGCGDTLTLNQYNTSEIWYIAYTDIDTVCESNELTADGSSILHSEEDYLLLSYVVDSNIEITKELKDGGWDHLILTNPQWIDRFGDPSKLKPVEYGSLANSMQEFLDVQMPILTADGNVLPDGVGLYQYDGETLLAFPVHASSLLCMSWKVIQISLAPQGSKNPPDKPPMPETQRTNPSSQE